MNKEELFGLKQFEFEQFKRAAFEGNTSDAMIAVKQLARIEQVDEFTVLSRLSFTFTFYEIGKISKFTDFLLDQEREKEIKK